MKKEQKQRYIKNNTQNEEKIVSKQQKKLSFKAKISILIVSGVLALGTIIGLVFVLSNLLNK
ncbi:MAG: hypothetical protein K2I49_01750 [Ureaplasma sp.]|nr:hypothetical protein [Ureaplasma sp.]